jgi:hypothetical protein
MTTTLGFAMFSFEGDKTVEAIANYFRNRKENGDAKLCNDSCLSVTEIIDALENLRKVDSKKFGEVTDTAVREAVLDYVFDGVKTVTFADGEVMEFPPTLTPDDYDHLKD